jgi:hypothetical protein
MKRRGGERAGGGAAAPMSGVLLVADADDAHRRPPADANSAAEHRPAKRACGLGALPPGALPPDAVALWAQALLGLGADELAAAARRHPRLALLLHSAAELDQALRAHHWRDGGDAPPAGLRGYVSLTRCARADLWAKFEPSAPLLASAGAPAHASACADPHDAADARAAAAAAARLLVRLLLLEPRSLGGAQARPHACMTRLTLAPPAWMAGWAARWGAAVGGSGGGAQEEVSMLLVTAHGAGADAGAGAAAAAVPAPWRVAVPLLPRLALP